MPNEELQSKLDLTPEELLSQFADEPCPDSISKLLDRVGLIMGRIIPLFPR
ncbi:hypothetical protein ACFOQM_22820 [Paenibacillus sp. GCM10012307]|uniref:Uncharacterized protein n=1 Tax=Paenibacillus roseus TaxID=2798579 RepID=A0A934MN42_9BACL|nr:hypothetical protein [Paenibacillus roseus]MBJ6364060.1 hypothetical protein [Paenibacillus roseus]